MTAHVRAAARHQRSRRPHLSAKCVPPSRVPSSLRPVFEDPADKDALYSEEQVRAALLGYARRGDLLVPGKVGTLRLDK